MASQEKIAAAEAEAAAPPAARRPTTPVSYEHSRSLPGLLHDLGVSLVVSTYQAGKVFTVGSQAGELRVRFHHFEKAMGIAPTPTGLAIVTHRQVWTLPAGPPELARQVGPGATHDICLLAREARFTGPILGHDLAWCQGRLWIVNTLFNCLCTLEPGWSFVPRWRPPFISEIANGDLAFVGLSRIRETAIFGGLPLDERRDSLRGGVAVVDQKGGQILAAVAEGLRACGVNFVVSDRRIRGDAGLPLLLGTTFWRAIEATGPYLLVDRCSFGDPGRFVSLVRDGHGRRGDHRVPERVDATRWERHGVTVSPWRQRGERVVLCGQTETCSPHYESIGDWYASVARDCTHFRRHPASRPNPAIDAAAGGLPETRSWDHCGRAVTLNSSVLTLFDRVVERPFTDPFPGQRLLVFDAARAGLTASLKVPELLYLDPDTDVVEDLQGIQRIAPEADLLWVANALPLQPVLDDLARHGFAGRDAAGGEPPVEPGFLYLRRDLTAEFAAIRERYPGSAASRAAFDRPIDWLVPIGDLGGFLRNADGDFPDRGGYLAADPRRVAAVRDSLAPLAGGRRLVGLAWTGGSPRTHDRYRRIPLDNWLPLLRQDACFVSLEYRDATTEITDFRRRHGTQLLARPDLTLADEYARTFDLVAALDLMITVPTSVLHVAGAVGVPCLEAMHHRAAWRECSPDGRIPGYPRTHERFVRKPVETGWGEVIERLTAAASLRCLSRPI